MSKRKKKPKWPPVLFVVNTEPLHAMIERPRISEESAKHNGAACEPYVSLTRVNELLATRGIDPIKVVDDNAEDNG